VAYQPHRMRRLEYRNTMTSLKAMKGGSIALLHKLASRMLMCGVHGVRGSGTYALGLCQGNSNDMIPSASKLCMVSSGRTIRLFQGA
jgi:hypothetical protein